MKNVITIADKEIRAYFSAPIAYAAFFFFLLISGLVFNANVIAQHRSSMVDIFVAMIYIFILLIPALTMHLFAEERRSGTIELLMTYPLQDWQVVLGKFAAGFGIFLGMLVLTFHFPLFLLMWGQPDLGAIVSGYFGLILLGATFLSIGMLTTSFTESPNVAGMAAAGIIFGFFILERIGTTFIGAGPFAEFISYISLIEHFRNFAIGTINSADIVFFFSVIFFALFVSVRIVEIKRWKS